MSISDHQKAFIIEIAKQLRRDCIGPDATLLGRCDILAPRFQEALSHEGIQSYMVAGSFKVDHDLPDHLAQYYDHRRARHVWLEVQGCIVDATADQFNPYMSEPLPEVVIGTYEDHPRYVKKDPWPLPDPVRPSDV